jgi:hypothetical protein
MKSLLAGILGIALIVSCKKDVTKDCRLTMPAIAGRYHITKLEQVAFDTGIARDITFSLTNCQLADVYTFSMDSIATCIPLPGCSNNGVGKWTVEDGHVSILLNNFPMTAFVSWNCSNLVMITLYPSTVSNDRYTFTKL